MLDIPALRRVTPATNKITFAQASSPIADDLTEKYTERLPRHSQSGLTNQEEPKQHGRLRDGSTTLLCHLTLGKRFGVGTHPSGFIDHQQQWETV